MAFTKYCLILFCLTASAKSSGDLSKNAALFAAAATRATIAAQHAYGLVEGIHHEAAVALMARHYSRDGFQPESIQPFLPPQDIQLRLKLLHGLRSYAASLGDVTGTKDAEAVDDNAAALGASLVALQGDSLTQTFVQREHASVSPDVLRGGAAAIAAIGHALQERRRRKELPAIVSGMQSAVDGVVELIVADIGSGSSKELPLGNGLRGEALLSFDKLIRDEILFIGGSELTATEKRAEIEKLPVLEERRRAMDQALAAVQRLLRDLAKAHRAVLSSEQHPATFLALITELQDEGSRIATVMAGK